jgi:hypothetical protein
VSAGNKVPSAGFVGDMRISYAKFLSLLQRHRIKRIIVYGDSRTAIVEVPHPWTTNIAGVGVDVRSESVVHCMCVCVCVWRSMQYDDDAIVTTQQKCDDASVW